MIRNPRARRALALAAIIAGAVLFFLVPEDYWMSSLLIGIGLALEITGLSIQHKGRRDVS